MDYTFVYDWKIIGFFKGSFLKISAIIGLISYPPEFDVNR